jgi:hypothetical protein
MHYGRQQTAPSRRWKTIKRPERTPQFPSARRHFSAPACISKHRTNKMHRLRHVVSIGLTSRVHVCHRFMSFACTPCTEALALATTKMTNSTACLRHLKPPLHSTPILFPTRPTTHNSNCTCPAIPFWFYTNKRELKAGAKKNTNSPHRIVLRAREMPGMIYLTQKQSNIKQQHVTQQKVAWADSSSRDNSTRLVDWYNKMRRTHPTERKWERRNRSR